MTLHPVLEHKNGGMYEKLRWKGPSQGRVWLEEPHGRMWFWHHHDEPEFNLVVRGSARYLLKNQRYDLKRNSLVWLFPQQEHLMVDMSDDFTAWIGVVRPAVMRQAIGADQRSSGLMAKDPPGSGCRVLTRGDTAFLEHLCHDVASGPGTARGETGLAYLFLAAWECFSQAHDTHQTAVHPALQLATAALSRNLAIDAQAAAAAAGISRFHLSRLFRRHMDTTLLAWRTRVRVEHAIAKRYEQPQRDWSDIAADCGFGSYAQFIRSFRSITRKSPRDWQ